MALSFERTIGNHRISGGAAGGVAGVTMRTVGKGRGPITGHTLTAGLGRTEIRHDPTWFSGPRGGMREGTMHSAHISPVAGLAIAGAAGYGAYQIHKHFHNSRQQHGNVD